MRGNEFSEIFQHLWGAIRRAQLDYKLALTASFSLVSAALVWLDAPLALRLPLGVLAVLYLPGYSLSVALVPREEDLDRVERPAFAFGLSLALIMGVVLALDYSPWGLSPASIVLALTACTLLATSAAWWRQRRLRPGEPSALAETTGERREMGRTTKLFFAVVSGAMVLVATALVVNLTAPPPRFTEFFIIGADGLAKDYPRIGRPGEVVTIGVGITNRERLTTTYRVLVDTEKATLLRTEPIRLSSDDTWEEPITFALPASQKPRDIAIKLFKEEQTEPYRQLRLRLDASPEEGVR